MFEELTFRNFLSFGPEAEPVRLGRLNVLVGPNGSGKSNFLDGIGLLAACPQKGALGRVLAAGGGVKAWLNYQGRDDGEIATLKAVVKLGRPRSEKLLEHSFWVEEEGQRYKLTHERIQDALSLSTLPKKPIVYFGFSKGQPSIATPGLPRTLRPEAISPDDSVLAQFVDSEQYPAFNDLSLFYDNIRFYREWTLGRNASIRRPGATDAAFDYLRPDAGNLAMVINNLPRSVRQQIVDRLQDLAPNFTGIETKVLASTIQLFLVEGDHESSALRLSDGTLRYLAMLVMFLHPNPPAVTVIEEPELGLHPDVLPGLARLMVDASARTQIIATTHSDIIIDALTEHPEAIRVCEKDEGGTSIRPIDADSLAEWLKEYGLGQAWLRGAIGGKRW